MSAEAARPDSRPPITSRWLAPDVMAIDNLLPELTQKQILQFLRKSPWQFGWKSKGSVDVFSFWHVHFGGYKHGKSENQYDCAHEIEKFPLLRWFWQELSKTPAFKGHTLIRCYANGQSYGTDGTVHRDSKSDKALTAIYYPHEYWEPNWAGDTVIFNKDMSDIVATIYPKPNRLAIFKGKMQHCARGVSRTCPELRITLMFKTVPKEEISNDNDRSEAGEVLGGARRPPDAA